MLWTLPPAERGTRITTKQAVASARVTAAIAPLTSALKLPASMDFTSQPFNAGAQGLGALLENVQVQTYAFDSGALLSLASARTPSEPSVWRYDDDAIPPVSVSTSAPPMAFGPALAAIEESYEKTRQGAAQFDPSKMNHAEIERVMQEFQSVVTNPDSTVQQALSLYKRLLIAMGFPAALADEVVRQLGGSNPQEGLDLLVSFFGPDGQKVLNDLRNMQTRQVSMDPRNLTAIFQINMGSKTFFQTWSLASGNALTGKTKQRDYAQQCMRTRYDGPQGYRISAESLIDNSVYVNSCDFEINYATCVWQVTGTGYSGCSTATTTSSVPPKGSTGKYSVRSGPLNNSRVFVACRAPATPVFQSETGPYTQQWQCMG